MTIEAWPSVLLFPGQGVQRPGMGAPWRGSCSWALVNTLSEASGHDVEELLLRTDDEALRRPDLAQIAVFSMCMVALAELQRMSAPMTVAACGHSLGEYAALVAVGAVTLAEGAALVAARGAAMREAAERQPGTMAVLLGADADEARVLCARAGSDGDEVWVANLNAPGQVVVSGSPRGVAAVRSLAAWAEIRAIDIAVGGAFHSPLMGSAVPRLRAALAATSFAERHLPVVANVDARPHVEGRVWPELAARQLTSPVRWEASMRLVVDRWPGPLLEVGPGRTLAGMVRRISPATQVLPVGSPAEAATAHRRAAENGVVFGSPRARKEVERCPKG